VIVVGVTAIALSAGIHFASRRNAVIAANGNDLPGNADDLPRSAAVATLCLVPRG
jgi:hypothetical protein